MGLCAAGPNAWRTAPLFIMTANLLAMTKLATKHEVWWAAAGCLPDSDTPAFVGSLRECYDWVLSEDAHEYWDTCGEYNTYDFFVVEAS